MRYVFLLLFICSGFAFGQNTKIDSLKKVIETTKVDTVKADALCELCGYLRGENDMAGSLKAGEAGLRSKGLNNSIKIKCLNNLANSYLTMGNSDRALEYNLKALSFTEPNSHKAAICHNNIANIYKNTGKYNKSLECFQKSLSYFLSSNKPYFIIIVQANIAEVYSYQGNYPKALACYQENLKLSEKIKDTVNIARSYTGLGTINQNLRKFEKALYYFQKAFEIIERTENVQELMYCQNNIATILKEQKKYSEALAIFEKNLNTAVKFQDSRLINITLYNIACTYFDKKSYSRSLVYYRRSADGSQKNNDLTLVSASLLGIGDCAWRIGQPLEAKKYGAQGLKMAREIGNLEYQRDGALIVSNADSALGNFGSAYDYYKLYKKFNDSLTNESKAQEIGRLESQFEFDKQTEAKDKQLALDAERRTRFYYLFGGIFTFVLAGAGFFYYNYRSKAKNNQILSGKNAEISSQKAELENAYEELNATLGFVQHQSEIIQHKNLQIEDSIRYAFQIQTAILPEPGYLETILPAHFIFYQPKDIVSGDFYQAYLINDLLYVIAADCTGHGVPGAFMSVVGTNALYNAINVLGLTDPDAILSELDRSVRRTLKQEKTSESKDGMDLALLIFSEQKQKIFFSGAGRPLYHLRDGNLTEIKGDKFPVGGSQYEHKLFTAHEIDISKGDRFYLFTDGITDQFGGESKKKFTPKRLQEFVLTHQSVSMSEQGKLFRQTMTEWTKGHKQLDDLTLIGLEV